jgi:hypothetical protein
MGNYGLATRHHDRQPVEVAPRYTQPDRRDDLVNLGLSRGGTGQYGAVISPSMLGTSVPHFTNRPSPSFGSVPPQLDPRIHEQHVHMGSTHHALPTPVTVAPATTATTTAALPDDDIVPAHVAAAVIERLNAAADFAAVNFTDALSTICSWMCFVQNTTARLNVSNSSQQSAAPPSTEKIFSMESRSEMFFQSNALEVLLKTAFSDPNMPLLFNDHARFLFHSIIQHALLLQGARVVVTGSSDEDSAAVKASVALQSITKQLDTIMQCLHENNNSYRSSAREEDVAGEDGTLLQARSSGAEDLACKLASFIPTALRDYVWTKNRFKEKGSVDIDSLNVTLQDIAARVKIVEGKSAVVQARMNDAAALATNSSSALSSNPTVGGQLQSLNQNMLQIMQVAGSLASEKNEALAKVRRCP